MQLSALISIAATLVSAASAKNILLTNDDGWAATNIRALYRDLKADGHNVVCVAPAIQMSGNGGKFMVPETNTLEYNALFNYPAVPAPSWGYEPNDLNMWYFNGTPAACVAAALDYVIPNYFNNMTIDLVVGGPNEGTNLGERDFAISGTIGATFYAVERGYPAIAFSASNSNNSFFKDNLSNDPNQAPNIYSAKSIQLIDALFDAQGDNERALPLSTALNVNFGIAGTDLDSECTDLVYQQTRLTGDKSSSYAVSYNKTSNLMEWSSANPSPLKQCLSGDCNLPSEYSVMKESCGASITVFTLDADVSDVYDAAILEKFNAIAK